jgi:hypothetical protein
MATYVVIAAAILIAAVFLAPSDDFVVKWVGLAVNTIAIFWYALRRHWQFSASVQFWVLFMSLLLVHLSLYIVILRTITDWKPVFFVLLYVPEELTIDSVLRFARHHLQW